MEKIKRVILERYHLHVNRIRQTPGGWTAKAYLAEADEGEYFVKAYDRQRSSIQPWIARMDCYMPALFWLDQNTMLHDCMAVPILTGDGDYSVECADHILVVFPMLKGITLGDSRLDTGQVRQLAAALAELHSYGNQIPVTTNGIKEDYSLPFLQELRSVVQVKEKPQALKKVMLPYQEVIRSGIEMLEAAALSLQNSTSYEALCHTDLHGFNLMWTNKLILIDWEGLRLAPVEADLFAFTEGFFYGYVQEEFMSSYRMVRKDYEENKKAMEFYRLRRRMEDIGEFVHSITGDQLPISEIDKTLHYLEQECRALVMMREL